MYTFYLKSYSSSQNIKQNTHTRERSQLKSIKENYSRYLHSMTYYLFFFGKIHMNENRSQSENFAQFFNVFNREIFKSVAKSSVDFIFSRVMKPDKLQVPFQRRILGIFSIY